MARLVPVAALYGSGGLDRDLIREVAHTTVWNMRPGRCAGDCGVGIARPNGGATNSTLVCPLCGSSVIQSTWGSKAVRKGYVVMSKEESLALARGEKIQVDRPSRVRVEALVEPVPQPSSEGMEVDADWPRNLGTHVLMDAIMAEPDFDRIRILNAELQTRLDASLVKHGA